MKPSALIVLLGIPTIGIPAYADDCCSDGQVRPWSDYNKGVVWAESLEDGLADATASGKLLMFFQLVGDLDKEGC